MKTFPAAVRAEYLSGDVTPTMRVTIRQQRMDFGSELYQYNANATIDGVVNPSDDYFDPAALGKLVLWGDSDVSDTSKNRLRVIAKAAWNSGGSTSMWRSWATPAADDWSYASLTGPGETLGQFARLGVYPVTSSNNFYVWYIDNAQDLRRATLNTTDWTFSSKTTAYNLTGFGGAAVHPLSPDAALVVAYAAPYLWCELLSWSGSWTSYGVKVLHMSNELAWQDAHWSDAVVVPGSGGYHIAVVANLTRWGSAHTFIYDMHSNIISQPYELFPSSQDFGNLKVWCSGLSVINNRIWAVTTRIPVGSGNVEMAHHVALASSTNGIDWRDEEFVTTSVLRGKLLHAQDSGSSYAHVAGNAAVARAQATQKLGYDNSTLKYQADEVDSISVACAGPSSAHEITLHAINPDGDSSALLAAARPGREITIEAGTQSQGYGTHCQGIIVSPVRIKAYAADAVEIHAVGKMAYLLGSIAYRPIAARVYDGPYSNYSRFYYDSGNARLTVRQETGIWTTEVLPELGRQTLHCTKPGIALIPNSSSAQGFVLRANFRPDVSVEGIYLIFWYENATTYWQAGVFRNGTNHYLVIDRVVNNLLAGGAHKATVQLTSNLSVGSWYSLYLAVTPGKVEVWVRRSDSFDFSTSTNYTYYATTGETNGPPDSYHVGLRIEDFSGWEGAIVSGTVDVAGWNYIQDDGVTFTSAVTGGWAKCLDQERQVVSYTAHQIWVDPGWSETPSPGTEYGVYPASAKDGPKCHFKDLFYHEAVIPWTVSDIVNNMVALAGVSLTEAYTGTGVGDLDSSSKVCQDADVTLETTQSSATFILWASHYSAEGTSAYSGLQVLVEQNYTTLSTVVSNNSETPPYQTTTVIAKHPNSVALPGAGTSRKVRVQATKDFIAVSVDGAFVTAFPAGIYWTGGYIAKATTGTAVTQEFPDILDSFIWDANEQCSSALQRLMRGRRAKFVERADGSVSVSCFDTPLGQAGTYTKGLVREQLEPDISEMMSIVEMVGAEERAFCIDPEAARQIGIVYVRADNPTLESQYAAAVEARRAIALARQRFEAGTWTLYITDPALELEDRFTVGDDTYLVDGLAFSLQTSEGIQARGEVRARKELASGNVGVYDTDDYDEGKTYGD